MINFSNFTIFETDICKTAIGQYSADCLNKWFCPQINAYVVNVGLILVIAVVVGSWGLWWFVNHGYKLIDYETPEWLPGGWAFLIFGDLQKPETRIFWVDFVKDREIKILVGFVIIIVFFFKK